MPILKKAVFGLAGVMALAAVVGLMLPRKVHVERSIAIYASAPDIFAFLDGYERFNEWSPWAASDPETHYEYSGPARGVGARMTWTSENPQVGSGSQEITKIEPNAAVRATLDFGEDGTAESVFLLEPLSGQEGTHVTWGFDADLGYNPVSRYVGLMFDRWVGADYEKGLASLKALVEREAGSEKPETGEATLP